MDINSVNFLEIGFWLGSFTILTISLLSKYTKELVPLSLLQFIRYGRLNFTKIKTNSLFTAIEVPKRWFAHFYIFAVVSQSVVVYMVLKMYYLSTGDLHGSDGTFLTNLLNTFGGNRRILKVDASTTVLTTFLYLLHLLRRLYECWFVSVYSNNTKMNIFVYLMSYGYYFAAILSLIAHSPVCSSEYGEDYTISWKKRTMFHVIGLAIFLYGFIEQYHAHVGFANLRKGDDHKILSHKHYIPKGRLFELISSPNYYAEIIIYIGLAFIFRFQNQTWNSVTMWVITSQILSGIMNHKWYLANFPQYPKQRNAIIPFIL